MDELSELLSVNRAFGNTQSLLVQKISIFEMTSSLYKEEMQNGCLDQSLSIYCISSQQKRAFLGEHKSRHRLRYFAKKLP